MTLLSRAFATLLLGSLLGTAALARTGPAPEADRTYEVSGWSYGSVDSLTAALAQGALDELDLDWYVSSRKGTVEGENWDPQLVLTSHGAGVKVLATVSNWSDALNDFDPKITHAILKSGAKRQRQVAALVGLCLDQDYDGIDLDWESLKVKDRDRFSSFVEDLAAALHRNGLLLAIAVHPKTSEPGDWSGAQAEDWVRLGAAADEFKVMTYEYSYPGGSPGPVAPPDWMSAVLSHAESLVPPSKIMMGLPFYGYDWSDGTAVGLNWQDVQTIIADYAPDVRRDPSGEATFVYTDATGMGHTVFFQDRQAVETKLQMMLQDHPGIRGASIWLMHEEDPRFWSVVASSLKSE
jgi:spore germination protein